MHAPECRLMHEVTGKLDGGLLEEGDHAVALQEPGGLVPAATAHPQHLVANAAARKTYEAPYCHQALHRLQSLAQSRLPLNHRR